MDNTNKNSSQQDEPDLKLRPNTVVQPTDTDNASQTTATPDLNSETIDSAVQLETPAQQPNSQTPIANSEPATAINTPKNRKGKKKLFLLAGVFGVIVLLFLFTSIAMGYIGVAPIATDLMNTNKPVDLGVRYSKNDLAKFQQKSLVEFYDFNNSPIDPTKPGNHLVISPANTIYNDFTQEEITAVLNLVNWVNSPIKNSQVRFGNGIVEFSGNIDAKYLVAAIKSINSNADQNITTSPVLKFAKYLKNPAIYIKANIFVTDSTDENSGGVLTLQNIKVKINRTKLPADLTSRINKKESIKVKTTTSKYSYDVRNISFNNGTMHFYGTIPGALHLDNGNAASICNSFHGGNLISLDNNGRVGTVITYCP